MNQRDPRDAITKISDWKCERFLLNELPEEEMEKIRRAADHDEHLRARLRALEQSNHEILEGYPPGRMGRQIREKLGRDPAAASPAQRKRRSWFSRPILVPAGALAAIALAVFVLPSLIPTDDRIEPEITRIKGSSPQLRLYRKTDSGSEQLRDGDLAAERDLVLLQYQTDDQGYGAILSLDGSGTVTRHLPDSGNESAALELRHPRLLDYAYELDDAPRWEVFVFVTSQTPFVIDGVVRAIEELLSVSPLDSVPGFLTDFLQSLDLPEGYRASTFTLFKDPPHEN